jgi:DeoR/GlpR family transcriptional regulator of sugar metabolism
MSFFVDFNSPLEETLADQVRGKGNDMLAAQRQHLILKELGRLNAVRVSELTELLHVSDMTVRRDLVILERRGLLERVHGGASEPVSGRVEEPSFEDKGRLQLTEKESIAKLAAGLVHTGQAIGISAGTTSRALARALCDVPGITVVTNSPPVAQVFWRDGQPDQTIVLTGGVKTPSNALVGPVAMASLRALNLDLVFMGVHGMDSRNGFTTPNLLEAETNRALVAAGQRLVVIADHTKWGLVGISTIASLSEAHILVTDELLSESANRILSGEVGELLLAPVVDSSAVANREVS